MVDQHGTVLRRACDADSCPSPEDEAEENDISDNSSMEGLGDGVPLRHSRAQVSSMDGMARRVLIKVSPQHAPVKKVLKKQRLTKGLTKKGPMVISMKTTTTNTGAAGTSTSRTGALSVAASGPVILGGGTSGRTIGCNADSPVFLSPPADAFGTLWQSQQSFNTLFYDDNNLLSLRSPQLQNNAFDSNIPFSAGHTSDSQRTLVLTQPLNAGSIDINGNIETMLNSPTASGSDMLFLAPSSHLLSLPDISLSLYPGRSQDVHGGLNTAENSMNQ